MAVIDLGKKISKYKKGWVALTPDSKRVVGSGNSLHEALEKAREKGVKDPTLLKVPIPHRIFLG